MRSYLLVAVGGALGALARWGVSELFEYERDEFPWSTLIVNVIGCAAVGIAARKLIHRPDWWRFAVTGLLGGFTTFSAFAVETRHLVDGGQSMKAFAYVACTIVVGLAATELSRRDWAHR